MGKAHVLQGLYVSNMTPSRRGWCSGRVSATYAGPTWPVQQGAAATGRQSRFQRSPEGPQTWGTVPHSAYIEFLASGSFFTGAGSVDTAQMFLLYTRRAAWKSQSRLEVSGGGRALCTAAAWCNSAHSRSAAFHIVLARSAPRADAVRAVDRTMDGCEPARSRRGPQRPRCRQGSCHRTAGGSEKGQQLQRDARQRAEQPQGWVSYRSL